jgi:hypothetical protein
MYYLNLALYEMTLRIYYYYYFNLKKRAAQWFQVGMMLQM